VAAPGFNAHKESAVSVLATMQYDESYSRVTLNLLPG